MTEILDRIQSMMFDAVAVAIGVLIALVAVRAVQFIRQALIGSSGLNDPGPEYVDPDLYRYPNKNDNPF